MVVSLQTSSRTLFFNSGAMRRSREDCTVYRRSTGGATTGGGILVLRLVLRTMVMTVVDCGSKVWDGVEGRLQGRK